MGVLAGALSVRDALQLRQSVRDDLRCLQRNSAQMHEVVNLMLNAITINLEALS
jgi:hypothetical protein